MAKPNPKPVRLWLEPGTVITCPGCGDEVAELKVLLRMGQKIEAKNFNMIQEHDQGGKMQCNLCAVPFIDEATGALHTADGWHPPILEMAVFRG